MDADGGIVLHMNYRIYSKKMYLNAKAAGQGWGHEVYITNLHFTPGETVTLTAKAEEGKFDIYINGEKRGGFSYRLPVTSIKRVQFGASDDSGSELKSLQIFY